MAWRGGRDGFGVAGVECSEHIQDDVNEPARVNIRGVLDARALRVLRQFEVLSVASAIAGRPRSGAVVTITAGDVSRRVQVVSRGNVGAASAWVLARAEADDPPVPRLVVAQRTTVEAREMLQHVGISYACGTGRLHLALPSLYVHVDAPRRAQDQTPASWRLSGLAGRVAQALLIEPGREWRIRDLAPAAGVSVGLAYGVVGRLQAEAIVETFGVRASRFTRVTDRAALLDAWCAEQVDAGVVSVSGTITDVAGEKVIAQVATTLERAAIPYGITRLAAVAVVTGRPSPATMTEVWISESTPPDVALATVGAVANNSGGNVVSSVQEGTTHWQ